MKLIRYYTITLLVLLLVACGKPQEQYTKIVSGDTVVAFGDSVTYGYNVSKAQNYPTLLAASTGWNVINAGISGERADQAKNRILSVIEQYQPKAVLIEFGGNDFLKRRDVKAVKEDLRAIIQAVKSKNALPILVAVPSLSPFAALGKPSDASIYRELADEENIPLIHSVFADVLRNEDLKLDQIHPNAQGYQQMTDGMVIQLRALGIL